MIKAVIFDMDGVIIDSEMKYTELIYQFARAKNPSVRIEQLFPIVGSSAQGTWSIVAGAIQNGQSWEELQEEYRELNVYKDIDYREIFRPEVRDVFRYLKDNGIQIALASSTGRPLVNRVLQENEILSCFDMTICGAEVTKKKPDPQIYLKAAAALGRQAGECLVVEDSTYGVTAGHRAGMTVAAIRDDRFQFDQSLADYHIDRVLDVISLLERLNEVHQSS